MLKRLVSLGIAAQVKKPGGLSLGAKVGIGLGITVGALALVYAAGCQGNTVC